MQLRSDIKSILFEIDFLNRYKLLSEKYPFADESFEKYSNEEVQKILKDLGYQFKFHKRENFFGVEESLCEFQFQFNINLKYGMVEFIWGLTQRGERITLGGPWGIVGDLLLGKDCEIKKPAFRNYEELNDILITAFKVYEDFKQAVVRSNLLK